MLNNSFTKTNTIFGQALGCTALDDAFVKLLSDVNADGVTQFLVRTNGEEKMKTVAQINSESLEAGVRERIFDKVSPKYGTPTYWDTSTNIYFSINTFHPQKSLRGKGIRRKADIEKLRALFFDIDCHGENAPADISDRIGELVLDLLDVLSNYKKKEERKANFVCRFELALRYLQANPCGEGNRHNTLLAVLSTCYDRGGHPDMDKAQLINRTFSQPLSDKEVGGTEFDHDERIRCAHAARVVENYLDNVAYGKKVETYIRGLVEAASIDGTISESNTEV